VGGYLSRFDLTGRTAVVAGGGGSLGSASALGLAEAGASVGVLDLRLEDAQRTAHQISAAGGKAIALEADLRSEESVTQAFEALDEAFGRLDILVNAVSGPVERFACEGFPFDAWARMLQSNLTSYFLCSREAARRMVATDRGGSIVNFASIAGVSALGRGQVAYAAAKGGVVQLTREMAYELAQYNVRVNAVLPSQFMNQWWSDTLADSGKSEFVSRVLSGIPLGRLGQPSEIVGPVLFLASDAASMVTGVLLPVDGGNLCMNAGASLSLGV
jgi:NAD(P)-dependent dehydrogenase (short-subunit alcohol dehydrogenase family)